MNRTVVFGLLAIVLAFGLIGCDTGDGSENNGCTVTFDLDGGNIGGNTSPVLRTVKSGETIALALFPQPVKQDYNLTGWITSSGNTFDENTKITSNLTVYAKWTSSSGNGNGTNPFIGTWTGTVTILGDPDYPPFPATVTTIFDDTAYEVSTLLKMRMEQQL